MASSPTAGSCSNWRLTIAATPSRECHTRPQVRRRAEPSPLGPLRRQRRLAGRPDDGPQPGPLDGADRSGRADSHHQDPPAAVLLPGRTVTRSARRLTLHLPDRWPWAEKFSRALARLQPFHSRPDGTVGDRPTHRTTPRRLVPARSREFPAAYSLAIPRIAAPADGHRAPCAAMKTVRRPPYPKWTPGHLPCSSLTPLPLSSRRPSVSFGGFGLSPNPPKEGVGLAS